MKNHYEDWLKVKVEFDGEEQENKAKELAYNSDDWWR